MCSLGNCGDAVVLIVSTTRDPKYDSPRLYQIRSNKCPKSKFPGGVCPSLPHTLPRDTNLLPPLNCKYH